MTARGARFALQVVQILSYWLVHILSYWLVHNLSY